ncbi:phage tail protein [Pseudomonas extremaustralis]|uniref:phage tail protein n=1 Tax=Pseudomonas extremaustralis TaxID=359110 RepID=UPI0021C682BF|nr:phage tail protein [Pseudomonas extremaustralis]UUJ43227.1 phage tail protein [Pseudomonas extremaustralis]
MNKPNSLREHLLTAVAGLKKNPDRLLIFIDAGSVRCTVAKGLSFEYTYSLQVLLTDFAGHPDSVFIPVLEWLRLQQPDLLTNLERGKDAIAFEADILDGGKVDMSLKLPLTERVIVKRLDDGSLDISHPEEPDFEL